MLRFFIFDAFLTHDWGVDAHGRSNHARVVRVGQYLLALGIKAWLDEVEMDGSVNQKMSEGIRDSAYVVFFITQRYLEKASGIGPNGLNDNWYGPRGRARARRSAAGQAARRLDTCPLAPSRALARRARAAPRAARSSSTSRCSTRARRRRSSL
jgi:hypothetical protein